MFKGGLHEKAIGKYSMAVNIAVQRPPWEAQQLMREELSTVLSNRSAAYFETGDQIASLVDSEIVIQIKRPWSKGHFRKAKALKELNQLDEAKEAIELGLSYEPGNAVSSFPDVSFRYGTLIKSHRICKKCLLISRLSCNHATPRALQHQKPLHDEIHPSSHLWRYHMHTMYIIYSLRCVCETGCTEDEDNPKVRTLYANTVHIDEIYNSDS